jgi:hypothetical protein
MCATNFNYWYVFQRGKVNLAFSQKLELRVKLDLRAYWFPRIPCNLLATYADQNFCDAFVAALYCIFPTTSCWFMKNFALQFIRHLRAFVLFSTLCTGMQNAIFQENSRFDHILTGCLPRMAYVGVEKQ